MNINPALTQVWKLRHLGSAEQCYAIMYSVARAMQAVKIVEVGTHRGFSAVTFCQAVEDNKQVPQLWTVDNWSSQPEARKAAESLIRKAGFAEHVKMITGNSADMLPGLLGEIGEVDLVFIDGCHKEEAVKQDILCVESHTDCLLLHDTRKGGSGYLRYLKEKWTVISFPTAYVEGDGHLVGITLAVKK